MNETHASNECVFEFKCAFIWCKQIVREGKSLACFSFIESTYAMFFYSLILFRATGSKWDDFDNVFAITILTISRSIWFLRFSIERRSRLYKITLSTYNNRKSLVIQSGNQELLDGNDVPSNYHKSMLPHELCEIATYFERGEKWKWTQKTNRRNRKH